MLNTQRKKAGYYKRANATGKEVIDRIKARVQEIEQRSEELVETICIIFVERAKQRLLDSGYYGAEDLVDNIVYRRYGKGKYRIGLRNNKSKTIMYFFEFGTGFVGRQDPHEMASQVGWKYLINWHNGYTDRRYFFDSNKGYNKYITRLIDEGEINKPTGINSLGLYVGSRGWVYKDNNGNYNVTSGLKAVSYMYDTMLELKDIEMEARKRVYGK